ncbi:hypothetical protein [Nocardia brasiliensis]
MSRTSAPPKATYQTFPGMGHDLPRELWNDIIDAIDMVTRRPTG